MGKKILDSKALYVVLSIVLSFSAWLFVISKDETKDSAPFNNLPIVFEDVDILEERNLMITSQDVRASITVQATPLVLATLKSDPPKLVATVASITTEGNHVVNYTVQLPAGVRPGDVEIISGLGGSTVKVEVARYLRREGVEIRGEFRGQTAEGYLAGDAEDFRFSPDTLTISGRAELVNQVAYAKVIVDGTELAENVGEELPFQLIGASGDPLDLDVTCNVDTVYTSFPIRATAEIPLEVKLLPGGGLSENDVQVRLSTPSIMVAGSREAVDALVGEGSIILATVDLAALDDDTAQNGGERTYSIPLADELENLSGVAEVKVTFRVGKRVETRTFEAASRISAVNVPEGWRADMITQVLPVRVRGSKALLDELTEEQIQVVADLREVNPAAGPHTVSASIYLYSVGSAAEVGVVDPGSYTVVVSLTPDG